MDWYEGEDDGGFESFGGRRELYYPILYGSEFWITYSSLKEVNGTLKESQLDVIFEPVSVSAFLKAGAYPMTFSIVRLHRKVFHYVFFVKSML